MSSVVVGESFDVGEHVVGGYGTNGQTASDGNGNFVVVWNAPGHVSGDAKYLYARMHQRQADGSYAVREAAISSTYNAKIEPTVAMAANGNFVVGWWGGSTSSDNSVRAQMFDAQFNPLGSEVIVATASSRVGTGGVRGPDVAIDNTGGFAVAWMQRKSGMDDFDVYVRRYTNFGAKAGKATVASRTTTGEQASPVLDMAADGSFIAAYYSAGDVFAQRFSSAGAKVGGEIAVAATAAEEGRPDVALLPGTSAFVSTWQRLGVDAAGNARHDVYAARFGVDGRPVAGANEVAATGGDIGNPKVDAAADGSVLVTWKQTQYTSEVDSRTTDTAVLAQAFLPGGESLGGVTTVAAEQERHWKADGVWQHDGGHLFEPDVVALGPTSDDFLVSYTHMPVDSATAGGPLTGAVRLARTVTLSDAVVTGGSLFSGDTINDTSDDDSELLPASL